MLQASQLGNLSILYPRKIAARKRCSSIDRIGCHGRSQHFKISSCLKYLQNLGRNILKDRPQVQDRIAEALKVYSRGTVLFVDDLLDYVNPESVKKALLRLKEKETPAIGPRELTLPKKRIRKLDVLFPSPKNHLSNLQVSGYDPFIF